MNTYLFLAYSLHLRPGLPTEGRAHQVFSVKTTNGAGAAKELVRDFCGQYLHVSVSDAGLIPIGIEHLRNNDIIIYLTDKL